MEMSSIFINETDFKYKLMRIDNDIDIDKSIEYIFEIYSMERDKFKEYFEYATIKYIVNKSKVLNILGVNAFNKQLYDLSLFVLRLSYSMDRNNTDTIYNLSYILYEIQEYDIAIEILKNTDKDIQNDNDIRVLMSLLKEKIHE